MITTKDRSSERISRRQVDKFTERRAELAEAALKTLAELGYARTSLREIAQNTDFSHGVLHYYFTDKVDLIMCCVRQYKARCVTRYDEVVAEAMTAEELSRGFAESMVETLRTEATLHRLWYDLRTQSLFEPSFRKDVAEIDQSLERMIWRIVTKHARLSKKEPQLTSRMAYAVFDGIFHQSLVHHLHGQRGALAELKKQVGHALREITLRGSRGANGSSGATASSGSGGIRKSDGSNRKAVRDLPASAKTERRSARAPVPTST